MLTRPFVHASLDKAELKAAPIEPSWIVEGSPQARRTSIVRLTDGRTWIDHWDCTSGRFVWHYPLDEVAHIVEGEAFITDSEGVTSRIAAGNVVTFRQGSTANWHVPIYIRKLAVMHLPLHPLFRFFMRQRDRVRNAVAIARRRLGLAVRGIVAAALFELNELLPVLAG